ncbi:MAG: biotin attachment protein [Proteobacteria bacterium]|nr:biotin attachment protein [Pseudomonadota bacterium]MBU1581518.1 biotin attachment protein [Pseudomonadota bacterium]MBU2454617.1 biotin attachment protein [Pseudomonadota bacterium]MBU2628070.1 biotin attachment protein [Pseudomonadota bacterium]
MKKINFMDTSLRDGFQSVFGARVLTDDFLPAVEAAVDAGIHHLEAGGGARFQSLFMYCGESAFSMMDRFRKAAGSGAHLQTLARGINVVALSAQPRDMIDLHARMFKKHGMTHIRNFDALNDVRNLVYSGHCIKNAGLHHQVVITMMELPPGCSGAHDPEFYLKTLKDILDSGVPYDSICFKDASGTSNPKKVYDTVKAARKLLGDQDAIWMHTHETAGIGVAQYKAAVEAGCDGICLARSPLSGGTCQPDMLSMWHALKGTQYSLDIDVTKILEANHVQEDCLKDYFFPPEAQKISSEVILSPMPGGALTANTMMMRDTGTLYLYPKVITAMSECIARGGFGTSVTPVSQFYFQQAYANVTQGPWKKITDGYGKMVLGYFGRTPIPPDPDIVRIAEKQMGIKVFEGDPLDVLEPGIPKAKLILETEGLPVTNENLFIIGALTTAGGNKGLDFLKGDRPINVRKITQKTDSPQKSAPSLPEPVAKAGDMTLSQYKVTVDGNSYAVIVEDETGKVTGISPSSTLQETGPAVKPALEIKAQLPGNVYEIQFAVGDRVKEGETLVVLEAMKMETPVIAPCNGIINSIEVVKGQTVQSGQVLLTLNE